MSDSAGGADRDATCQECGGDVHLEVEWSHWGIEAIYGECRDCGMAGWTDGRCESGENYAQEEA